MNISTKSIVSNSDMIKNYKACREKAQFNGKIFILKNNQPDAVLFSIDEYERLSVFIEYMESMEDKDIAKITALLPVEGSRKTYSFDHMMRDIDVGQPQE
ncbi:MAG: type II toxin-antitoxin system Phd/YefM family antitoxin [Clostridiaceae bacterium]|nr:type II toxin-antitoxin system Phd/YefM family antitoxin [Clostridiaceae bacterium]